MRVFGLIGYPLSHSFSKKYFTEKFQRENIPDASYELFEIEKADFIKNIIGQNQNLKGLNVTIPHKETIIPFLDELDEPVKSIKAVNVIKVLPSYKLKGYNSDFHGFRQSLLNFIPKEFSEMKALVFGTGGASKAVKAALEDLGIHYRMVSRSSSDQVYSYDQLTSEIISGYQVLINTTPLGMHPNIESSPAIPYQAIGSSHYLFDLVYNPEETLFMKKGMERGAQVKNGLEMLVLQAEKAWEIWNK